MEINLNIDLSLSMYYNDKVDAMENPQEIYVMWAGYCYRLTNRLLIFLIKGM